MAMWGMDADTKSMPCFRCGVCCTRYNVRISFLEARRIADGLGVSWREFLSRYIIQDGPSPESFVLRRQGEACVFLETGGTSSMSRCLVHPFKPSACREWSPSLYRRDCREGLARYWGLAVNSSGSLDGPEQNLKRFRSFLESLPLLEMGDISHKISSCRAIQAS